MSNFYYLARDKEGKRISGVEEALTRDELVARLQGKGLLVVKVMLYEAGTVQVKSGAKKGMKFGHHKIKTYDLVLFARQLAVMLSAGVNLIRSLDVILRQIGSERLHAVVAKLKKDVEGGKTFRDAISEFPNVFPPLWVNLVETGEASGNLSVVLEKLAYYVERRAEFKTKIVSALLYPAILTFVAVGALVFFLLKIIPTFSELFRNFGMELPVLTQMVVKLSFILRKRLPFVMLGVVVIAFLLGRYVRTVPGRKRFDQFKLNLPFVGKIFRVMAVERFTSEMATLIESGVPILYALEITERSVGNKVLEGIIRNVKVNVREGKPLAIPLEKSGFFSPMVVQMISIGEEIGELTKMLKRISLFYEEYVNTFIDRFATIFEPLMMILIGGLIGTLVISMFLPIFKIATAGMSM